MMPRRVLRPTSSQAKPKQTPTPAPVVYGRGAVDRIAGLTSLHRGIVPKPDMLFGVWLEHFVTSETTELTPSTRNNYKTYLKRILPELGAVKIGNLNTLMLRSFMDSLIGLSSSTRQKIHGLLKRALQDAVNLEVIPKNPMNAVKRPKTKVEQATEPLEPEQVERFFQSLSGHRLELVFHLCFTLGLRIGEACALRWQDVRGSVLQVNHTINRHYTKTNGQPLLHPAKSGSARELRLDADTIARFEQHRAAQHQESQTHGAGFNPDGFVFVSKTGTALDTKNVHNRVFKEILDKSGLRQQGTHAMRKTYATFAAVVLPIQDVQARLGHSDPRMTLSVYAKVQARRNVKAALSLEQLVQASKVDGGQDA
jgi:integrase